MHAFTVCLCVYTHVYALPDCVSAICMSACADLCVFVYVYLCMSATVSVLMFVYLCIQITKWRMYHLHVCVCIFFPYWEWHVQNQANRNYKMQDLFSIYFAICTKITPHKVSQGRAAPSAVVIIKSQRSLHPVRLTALLFIISIHTCPNP